MINLEKGNSGPLVEMLQLALKRAGKDVEINGNYDEKLVNIVKEFQQQNNLQSDGVVGPATWQLLEPYITGYREITVTEPTTQSALAQMYGVSTEVLRTANPDLGTDIQANTQVVIPFDFDIVPEGIAYTAELVSLIIRGLAARYGFLENGSIGKSVMGKDIEYMKIGTGETQVFFNAEHHANEWITTPLLLKFAEQYAKAYATGEDIDGKSSKNLFDTKSLYIVPAVNPDGLDVVNGALPVGEYYNNVLAISKNYPQIPFPNGWKANVAGTDLNLNYPANWNKAKQNKYALGFISPAPRDFVGTEPLSAPESLAVYDFTNQHRFALTLSYHSQGKVIYWKYLNYQPENSYKIGQALAEASGYSLDLTPPESGYAGYKDWFIQAYNKPGYTIEVGIGESPLPWSQFDEIYNDNIGLLTTALEMA